MEYKTKKYDNTNKGVLFLNEGSNKEPELVIRRRGNINIDGQTYQIYGIPRKNKEGKPIMALVMEFGTLKINEKRQKDSEPNVRGILSVLSKAKEMAVAGWNKKTDDYDLINLKIQNFNDEKKPVDTNKDSDF